jgi:hypothetical protein
LLRSVASVAWRPAVLPTLEGTARQVDDAKPQEGHDGERPQGARELPELRRQKPLLLEPDSPTPLSPRQALPRATITLSLLAEASAVKKLTGA